MKRMLSKKDSRIPEGRAGCKSVAASHRERQRGGHAITARITIPLTHHWERHGHGTEAHQHGYLCPAHTARNAADAGRQRHAGRISRQGRTVHSAALRPVALQADRSARIRNRRRSRCATASRSRAAPSRKLLSQNSQEPSVPIASFPQGLRRSGRIISGPSIVTSTSRFPSSTRSENDTRSRKESGMWKLTVVISGGLLFC